MAHALMDMISEGRGGDRRGYRGRMRLEEEKRLGKYKEISWWELIYIPVSCRNLH